MLDKDWTNEQIVILAFDHRGSFMKKLFGISGRPPTPEETKTISEYKDIIYDGFKKAIENGVSKDIAGILVDEQFGSQIAKDAKNNQIRFAMSTEKSGQKEFDFEYGTEYSKHIEEFDPNFSKVLVRLNPEDDEELNNRQIARLKDLGDYLKTTNRPYLFELLVPATEKQLESFEGNTERYDLELRPKMMAGSIKMLQDAGVEPDIWKLEGIDKEEDVKLVVDQVQSNGRKAGVIILGRGADDNKVTEWLTVGSKVPGVIGFAIGRTIFWDALKGFKDGNHDRDKAVDMIAQNYKRFADLWVGTR